jgi:formylglycine-generating enzyme required for sulfatase activity
MVFLSYAREDRQCATQLMHELAEKHIECVVDPDLVEGDPFWRESVAESFGGCALMVGLVSAHALASPWVEQEQRAFAGRKLWVLVAPEHAARLEVESGTDPVVALDRAVAAVRDALACHPRSARPRSAAVAAKVAADRVARTQQAEAALAAFRAALPRLPRPRVEFGRDVAQVGGGFLTLHRATGTKPAVWIGTLPVTNAQYRAFLQISDYPEPPTWTRAAFRVDEAPVTGVNWFEAFAFARWVGGTLPTEADWVTAAQGSPNPARAYATATGELSSDLARFGQPFGASAPVSATAYPPNAEGFYGMCGNTWDWSASAWATHRMILGGGVMDAARFCAIPSAYRNAPIDRDCCVGFRVKIDTCRTE